MSAPSNVAIVRANWEVTLVEKACQKCMMDASQEEQKSAAKTSQASRVIDERLRAIAYSMDALIPGLYIWLGAFKLRVGGSLPEATYPGTIHSPIGITLVLPGYRIYTTYHGSYDP